MPRGGAPLLIIAKVLGHRDPSSTQKYAKLLDDSVRAVVERANADGTALLSGAVTPVMPLQVVR